jgi:subtilisin-like proprotein convertase family protein
VLAVSLSSKHIAKVSLSILVSAGIMFMATVVADRVIAAEGGEEGPARELVRTGDGVPERLAEEGAVILEDYGRFLLVERRGGETSEGSTAETDRRSSRLRRESARGRSARPLTDREEALPSRPVPSRVALPSVSLDTDGGIARRVPETDRAPDYLATPMTAAPGGEGLHVVQFHGPIKPEWIEAVRAEGIDVISYLPENAYLVRATAEQIGLLDSAPFPIGPAGRSPLHWTGEYRPEYKIEAELLAEPPGDTEIVVRMADGPEARELIDRLTADGERQILEPLLVDRVWVVPVKLPAEALVEWAGRPDVVQISRWHTPELFGEVGALNVAGQRVDGTTYGWGEAGVDYMSWLQARGFDLSSPWSFAVNVTDTGLDKGLRSGAWHPDFMEPDGTGARMVFVKDWTTDKLTQDEGVDGNGHGTNCAGIIGGYNDSAGTGTSTVSSTAYHFGTGVAPAVQLGGSKVFTFDGAWSLDGSYESIEHYAYDQGARISSNSWGSTASFDYDYAAYVYDSLVRDATPDSGSQPMVVLFAAGNEGPGAGTVSSPGTAKNVITLGAAENWWPGYSACGWSTAMTDTPGDDIVYYSSRGPVGDGRIKPDLAAIANGWVTTRGQYAGTGCGAPYDTADGTLYRNFNGTSAATPAAAGAAALIYQHALQNWGAAPSPAMVKAMLVSTARDLAGGIDCDVSDGSGPELAPIPNGSQGFGLVDTGRAFDGTPAIRLDQSVIFESSGESWMEVVTPADPTKDVRVALAWTDAPGSSSTRPWVNDLDLTVIHLMDELYGNHLEGGVSVSGGSPDGKNNLEVAVLPVSDGDAIEVEVAAANIAGNGLPNEGGFYDQDFALYVYNAEVCSQPDAPTGVAAIFDGGHVDVSWSPSASGSISSYRIYRALSDTGPWTWIGTVSGSDTAYSDWGAPGGATVYYMVRAVADCESRPSVSGSVDLPAACPPTFAGIREAASTHGGECGIVLEWDAATEGCVDSDVVYRVYRSTDPDFVTSSETLLVDGVQALGYVDAEATTLEQEYTYIVRAFDLTTGASDANTQRASARPGYCVVGGSETTDIPDDDASGVSVSGLASGVDTVSDVQLALTITHPFMGDLSAALTSPSGTTVHLLQPDGADGSSNLDTTFDLITQPDGPGSMSDFDGESGDGAWTLELADTTYWYEGTLDEWSLELTRSCSALAGDPGEVSPNLELSAAAAAGTAVRIDYIPAANSTDTCVFSGRTFGHATDAAWSSSSCGLGVSGTASFDPGALAPGEMAYFVAVGSDGVGYGSFGRDSNGVERAQQLASAFAPEGGPRLMWPSNPSPGSQPASSPAGSDPTGLASHFGKLRSARPRPLAASSGSSNAPVPRGAGVVAGRSDDGGSREVMGQFLIVPLEPCP